MDQPRQAIFMKQSDRILLGQTTSVNWKWI